MTKDQQAVQDDQTTLAAAVQKDNQAVQDDEASLAVAVQKDNQAVQTDQGGLVGHSAERPPGGRQRPGQPGGD